MTLVIWRLQTLQKCTTIANTWTYMPSMVERRSHHSLVAIKSKLFAVGNSEICEIYDEVTKVFTLVQVPLKYIGFCENVQAISI